MLSDSETAPKVFFWGMLIILLLSELIYELTTNKIIPSEIITKRMIVVFFWIKVYFGFLLLAQDYLKSRVSWKILLVPYTFYKSLFPLHKVLILSILWNLIGYSLTIVTPYESELWGLLMNSLAYSVLITIYIGLLIYSKKPDELHNPQRKYHVIAVIFPLIEYLFSVKSVVKTLEKFWDNFEKTQ